MVRGMRDGFEEILARYALARANKEPRKGHDLWTVFKQVADAAKATEAVQDRPNLKPIASVGQDRNFSAIPWIALLDTRETNTTQQGVYCVYLFREDMSGVYLALAQGVESLRKQYGGLVKAKGPLQARVLELRKYCDNLPEKAFSLSTPDLHTQNSLGKAYEDSTIAHKFYGAGSVPSDSVLAEDLENILTAYDLYLEHETLKHGTQSPFSAKTFSLLSGLHETPKAYYYEAHKEEFKEHLEDPFQGLLRRVADRLPTRLAKTMETQSNIFAKIRKNDYGQGGAWDFYWGAFYPKGGKRTEDAQLFMWINREVLEFGFYIGRYGSDQRERFIRNCEEHRETLLSLLGESLADSSIVYGRREEAAGGPLSLTGDHELNFEEWLGKAEGDNIRARVVLSRQHVLDNSEEQLAGQITGTFERLFPLILLAIHDNPIPLIEEYLGVKEPELVDRGPLNVILYGPPGTGKTYSVQRRVVRILRPDMANASDDEVRDLYRRYVQEGRVEFVTFHPSYSYEEFVEGFRYDETTGKPTRHDGIFLDLVDRASVKKEVVAGEGARVWKVTLGRPHESEFVDRAMTNGEITIGWLEDYDLTGMSKEEITELFTDEYEIGNEGYRSVNHFVHGIREGDYVVVFHTKRTIQAIGVVTGEYSYKGGEYGKKHPHTRSVRWLDQSVHDVYEMNGFTELARQTITPLGNFDRDALERLLPAGEASSEPYVLVIDEINRGNLSRIFGELITLIEEDKRQGASNELSAKLLYSGDPLTVPANLYFIGTMNTADRSIALVDTALRRRFEFEEMMPSVDVVRRVLQEKAAAQDGAGTAGLIDLVCGVLEVLNKRISLLLDRDHQVGHSYFLEATTVKNLREALYRRVFPLVQEYFYNDPGQLERVLGSYDKPAKRGFVQRMEEYSAAFPDEDVPDDELPWEFHVYPDEELEEALRNTFLS